MVRRQGLARAFAVTIVSTNPIGRLETAVVCRQQQLVPQEPSHPSYLGALKAGSSQAQAQTQPQ